VQNNYHVVEDKARNNNNKEQ